MEEKKDEKLNNAVAPPQTEEQTELEKLKAERDEYLNGWKRAKADLINYQKDEAKRFQEMARYGVEMALADMITILDSFDLAEKNGVGNPIIKNQLEDTLKKRGLERMKINIGDAFDPSYHESIGEMDAQSGKGVPGTIIEVAVAGYALDGKVVRPAKVKIVKSP
ncbi:MAG: nucleotide exchange factor GrpE [Patescibacteria group bacterium]